MAVQPIVGLDIGATKIACAVGVPCEDRPGLNIIGTSLVANPSFSTAWPEEPLSIGRTIERALEAACVDDTVVQAHVACSHPALQSETVHASIALSDEPITVRRQDLERLRRSAFAQALPVDREALVAERLACSGNGFEGVRDPEGLMATRLRGSFHLVTIPIAVRRSLTQAVESAGLEVASLAHSLEAAACVFEEINSSRRVLVIDIGGLSTDVGLFSEGHLRASVTIAWGGLKLASALATKLRVTLEQASTLGLQGLGSPRREARECFDIPLRNLQRAIQQLIKTEPLPDLAILTGRAALADGLVEWVERVTKIKSILGRSAYLQERGDLSNQVGLTAAVGIIKLAVGGFSAPIGQPSGFVERIISRTKTVLTEYF